MLLDRALNYLYTIGNRLTSLRRVPYENLDARRIYREQFPEPSTYVDRSYLQYLCQYSEHKIARRILNILSAPVLVTIYLIKIRPVGSKRIISRKASAHIEQCIGIMDAEKELVPVGLRGKYGDPVIYPLRGEVSFDDDAINLFNNMIPKYWYEPHFLLKLILRIGRYSYLIGETNCQVVVSSAEYSFASAALTGFCEAKGINHINIMHGEKIINPVDAFCSFHEFYVWHEHYVPVFRALRAKVARYTVERPSKYSSSPGDFEAVPDYDYTYYLGWELSDKDVINIKKTLSCLRASGNRLCVRAHPRFGDRREIKSIFHDIEIQWPEDIPLDESIIKTRNVISLMTSVFWDANEMGRGVIIDDVSNTEFYRALAEVSYFWVLRPHTKLSSLLDGFSSSAMGQPGS